MKTSLIISFLLAAFISQGCAAQEGPTLSHEEFNRKITQAHKLVETQKYEQALQRYEELADVRLFEVPNYQPFYYIAETKYFLGQHFDADATLKQFKCMLRVDSGVKKCSNAADYKNNTPDNTVIYKSDFADLELCHIRMCSELYHSYYTDPSKATLQRIAKFWSDVDQLQSKIGNATTEKVIP